MSLRRHRPRTPELRRRAQEFHQAGRTRDEYLEYEDLLYQSRLGEAYELRSGEKFTEMREEIRVRREGLECERNTLDQHDEALRQSVPEPPTAVSLGKAALPPGSVLFILAVEWAAVAWSFADLFGFDPARDGLFTPPLLLGAGLGLGVAALQLQMARIAVRGASPFSFLALDESHAATPAQRLWATLTLIAVAGVLAVARKNQLGISPLMTVASILIPALAAAVVERQFETRCATWPQLDELSEDIEARVRAKRSMRRNAKERRAIEKKLAQCEAQERRLDQLESILQVERRLLRLEAEVAWDRAANLQRVSAGQDLGNGRRRVAGVLGILGAVALIALLGGMGNRYPREQKGVQGAPRTAAAGVPSREPGSGNDRRRTDSVRAVYVHAGAFRGPRFREFVALADTTEVNGLVIDVKNDRGLLTYRSAVHLPGTTSANGSLPLHDARRRLETLREHGVTSIARIVVAKDPRLARARPAWAIQNRRGGVWYDGQRSPWLDPFRDSVWMYVGELAAEAIALGFGEIQLDYVRLPDEAPPTARFPAREPGVTAREAVVRGVRLVRDRLPPGTRLGVDVFGIVTLARDDVGIGQVWEDLAAVADVISPMVYPSHFAPGSFGFERPNGRPAQVVRAALRPAVERSNALRAGAVVRPYLQAFTLGSPAYGAAEVRAQIAAVEESGIGGWILWNPGSEYDPSALRAAGEVPGLRRPRALVAVEDRP